MPLHSYRSPSQGHIEHLLAIVLVFYLLAGLLYCICSRPAIRYVMAAYPQAHAQMNYVSVWRPGAVIDAA